MTEAQIPVFPNVPVPPNGESLPIAEPTDTELDSKALADWLFQHHRNMDAQTVAKAAEYGSLDLRIMGAVLAVWPGIPQDSSPETQMQAAIAFYLLGKLSRVLSALGDGNAPPTDSWFDSEVYSLMGRYVQENGQWP